jgi:mxaD protein
MLRKLWIGLAVALLALPGVSMAAKRAVLQVNESVLINGTPNAVWAVVKDWDGLHKWHPAFGNDTLKSGANGKVGSMRTLTLKDGGATFDEELLAYNEKKKAYKYRIVGDSPFPVTDYVSWIHVKAGGKKGTAVLMWKGSFKRKVADNPPPDQNDKGVKKMISGAYQAGLGNVKNMVEGK